MTPSGVVEGSGDAASRDLQQVHATVALNYHIDPREAASVFRDLGQTIGDRIIVPATAQRFAADIPGSRVQVFDDLGHVPHEEDPGRTIAPVKAFLGL